MSNQRIPPLAPDDWDGPAMDDALAAMVPSAAAMVGRESAPPDRPRERTRSNLVEILAWHPPLAKAYFQFNTHLFHSTLSDRVRELAIVRTGWVRQAEYEWSQHVRLARVVGVSDVEIAAVSEGPDAALWGPFEAAVLRAVDEILQDRYVSDATWNVLAAEMSQQQLMDLVFTVGAYDLLGMAMNTFGLELDPGLEHFPTDQPA